LNDWHVIKADSSRDETGALTTGDFSIVDSPMPGAEDGQVL
jgi:hypothetical protein